MSTDADDHYLAPLLTAHDLELQIESLFAELTEIDCQLGDVAREDELGPDYDEWRTKACRAKRVKLIQYRALRRELRLLHTTTNKGKRA